MTKGERFDRIEALFREIGEHLTRIRHSTTDQAKLAVLNHEERVEEAAQKIRNARRVLGND